MQQCHAHTWSWRTHCKHGGYSTTLPTEAKTSRFALPVDGCDYEQLQCVSAIKDCGPGVGGRVWSKPDRSRWIWSDPATTKTSRLHQNDPGQSGLNQTTAGSVALNFTDMYETSWTGLNRVELDWSEINQTTLYWSRLIQQNINKQSVFVGGALCFCIWLCHTPSCWCQVNDLLLNTDSIFSRDLY